jgi:hypothetical protein
MENLTSPPSDGWEGYEKHFLRAIIVTMYCRVRDPIDKFILIAKYESNYCEQEIGRMLKMSQPAINKRLKKIRAILFRAKKNNAL